VIALKIVVLVFRPALEASTFKPSLVARCVRVHGRNKLPAISGRALSTVRSVLGKTRENVISLVVVDNRNRFGRSIRQHSMVARNVLDFHNMSSAILKSVQSIVN
jgi:hypothetical protein